MSEEPRRRYLSVGRWGQLSRRHNEDSIVLWDNRRLIGAIYLKGYAIECMLKMKIASRFYAFGPPGIDTQEALDACFSGKSGHNLALLFEMALSDKNPLKNRIRMDIFQFASMWSVDLRYSTRVIERNEAASMLRLGTRILKLLGGEEE